MLVNGGAVDSETTILAGGSETILGSAAGDQIYGTQLVSAAGAAVTSETVQSGGKVELFLAGVTATGTTVLSGGFFCYQRQRLGNQYRVERRRHGRT